MTKSGRSLVEGCVAKLDRAAETIRSLKVKIDEYLVSEPPPFHLIGEHQNNGLQYSMIAKGSSNVPLILSVLTGEIIHQMRSSLDHLITALVVNNGGTPTRFHQFPICTSDKFFKDLHKKNGAIEGISKTARTLIESVQPFTSPTPDDTILHVVHQMNNMDKHRLLIVVAAAGYIDSPLNFGQDDDIARQAGRTEKNPIITGFVMPQGLQKITPEGSVLFGVQFQEPAPEFTAEGPLVSHVVFEKCGRVENAIVVETLERILQGVGHTVNQFSGEFMQTPSNI